MRTAYQGKYFEFLTGDMRKRPVATIEDMKKKNFTVFIEENNWFYKNNDPDILEG